MADQTRKAEVIRSIQQLQLGEHLIGALDDQQLAKSVVEAVSCLNGLSDQWN